MIKPQQNPFGAFDQKPGTKRWVFWLKSDETCRWTGCAPDWFMGRQLAATSLGVSPSLLIGMVAP